MKGDVDKIEMFFIDYKHTCGVHDENVNNTVQKQGPRQSSVLDLLQDIHVLRELCSMLYERTLLLQLS